MTFCSTFQKSVLLREYTLKLFKNQPILTNNEFCRAGDLSVFVLRDAWVDCVIIFRDVINDKRVDSVRVAHEVYAVVLL